MAHGTRRREGAGAIVACLVALGVLAACSDGDDEITFDSTTTESTTTAEPTTTTEPPPPNPPPPRSTTKPQSGNCTNDIWWNSQHATTGRYRSLNKSRSSSQ
jgi:hypothetical protein